MVNRNFALGIMLGAFLTGCTGAVFSYHYYGLLEANYSMGKLTGPKPEDDLPFSVCEPTKDSKSPCVVMKAAEFFALKQDYLDTQNKLISCQKGIKP